MGPHNACSYADIAMHTLDLIINNNPEFVILLWCRFRDDIFSPWHTGLEKLLRFTDWINTLHPRIKFTLVYTIVNEYDNPYLETKFRSYTQPFLLSHQTHTATSALNHATLNISQ